MSERKVHEGGTVAAGFMRDLPAFAVQLGIDLEPFANAVGIDSADFHELRKRVSLDGVCRLFSALSAITGQDTLGLDYGKFRKGGASGAFGQGFVSAPTVKDMLLFYTKYIGTVVDHRSFEASCDRQEVVVAWDYSPLISSSADFVDAAVVSFKQVLDSATKGRQIYRAFRFRRSKPQNLAAFRDTYPASLAFGAPMNSVVLSARELAANNPYANEVLFELMVAECEQQLGLLRASKSLLSKLKEEIMEALATGGLPISTAASRTGLSIRTLQRRLQDEGVTYDKLVEQTRFSLIEAKLRDTSDPLGLVAAAVGYSDQSSFTRAITNKYGCSPSELRLRLTKG